jgi:hypothetical protein
MTSATWSDRESTSSERPMKGQRELLSNRGDLLSTMRGDRPFVSRWAMKVGKARRCDGRDSALFAP